MEQKDLFDLFHLIKENVHHINYWRGPNSVNDENKPPGNTKSLANRKLSLFQEYLMTLVYVHQNRV